MTKEKQAGFAGMPDFGYLPKYTIPVAAGLAALGFGFANREDIKPHIDYARYLIPHKWHVGKGMRDMDLEWGQTLKHDLSKFGPHEWPQYVAYFNGPKGITGTNDRETYLEWRKAVQHHYDNNAHHWRALHKEPKDVPMKYRLEAIADWYGVSRAKGKTQASFKNWYQDKELFLPIDNTTKEEARKRLGMGPMNKVGFSVSAERNFAHSAARAVERHDMSLPKEVWQKLNLVINEGGGKYIRQASEPKTHIYEVMHENKPLRVIYHDEDKVIKTVLPQKGAPAKVVGKVDLSKTGAAIFDIGPIKHSIRKSMESFAHISRSKHPDEFSDFKAKFEPLIHEAVKRLPNDDRAELLKEWQTTVNIAAPRPVMKPELEGRVKVVTDGPVPMSANYNKNRYERTGDVMSDMSGGKVQAHMPSKYAAAKPPMPSTKAPHVPMSMIVASLDPAVLAVSRNVDPAKQKKIWERYARIVLENRNYGRKGRAPGEYIKTQVHKD